jgi:hypothetical protein
MLEETNQLSRRAFVTLASSAAAGCSLMGISSARAEQDSRSAISLFDGKTLHGWIQIENSAISLTVSAIADQAAFVGKLTNGTDAVSLFLRGRLEDSGESRSGNIFGHKCKCEGFAVRSCERSQSSNSRIIDLRLSTLRNIALQPETEQLLQQDVHGMQLARLNMLLLEDAYPAELAREFGDWLGGKGWPHSQQRRRARRHVYGERLRTLPSHVDDETRLGQARPSCLRPCVLYSTTGGRDAARCSRRHSV